MAAKYTIKLSASFEHNLELIEVFLEEAGAPLAFDALLDELGDTVFPNLERFPGMGRLFLGRPRRSVEVSNGTDRLSKKLAALARDGELREYVMSDYLLLYAVVEGTVYVLSIRHHRQLSFDFSALWPRT